MKRLFPTLLISLAACAIAFGLTFFLTSWLGRAQHACAPGDTMTWLQQEFSLTPAQTEAIRQLHAAYEPICEQHCLRIQEVKTKMETVAGDEARAAVQADFERLTQLCRASTLAHLQQVASHMTPEQGRRFLALTEPKLETTPHDKPVGWGTK